MIEFKEIQLQDKIWMQPLYRDANLRGCHHNFSNIFIWSKVNKKGVARVNDYIVVKIAGDSQKPYYFYPAGLGDIKPVIEQMKKDARDSGHDFILDGLSPENMAELDQLFPRSFKYKKIRDNFDYVYLLDKMISLSGKKLSAKRNHINSFKKNHQWTFEPIRADNLDECWQMSKQWCIENDCDDNDTLKKEACAVRVSFENFFALELEGGLIRCDGKVIAYTMGEILNSDTYVIHIEKAFGQIRGAYPMINREFAERIKEWHPQLIYVNREEDVGDPGLRKAKKSYYPERMEKKYLAKFVGS